MKRMHLVVAMVSSAVLWSGWLVSGQAPAQPPAHLSTVTKEQFARWMTELSNWGRWGKDDELGTVNLVTPAKRKQAAALVQTGTTVSLSREIPRQQEGNGPQNRPVNPGGSLRNLFLIQGGYLFERQEIEYHGSLLSHFDALCHVSYNGTLYNGFDFKTVVTPEGGCSKLAVTGITSGIVTRGLLLDIPGTRVRREDIDAWEKRTGLRISSGDALLLRTKRPGAAAAEFGSAGYEPSLIPFLKERDVALLGADVPQEGGNIVGISIPIHTFTIVALGMNLLDNLDLEALAATAAKLKRWDFMLTVEPLRVQNGAGSAVNPIAVF